MTAPHAQPTTPHEVAERLRVQASRALAAPAPDPSHDPLSASGADTAFAYAALAGATQLADLGNRLLAVGQDVRRIADTVAVQAAQARQYTELELQVVRAEVARTDTKSSILLASVAIVAGLLAQKAGVLLAQPWPVSVLGVIAVAFAAAATWLLLDVVLPRLVASTNSSFLHYAGATPAELDVALGEGADRRGELVALSLIARSKFRQLARAGVLLKSSGVLLASTALLAAAF